MENGIPHSESIWERKFHFDFEKSLWSVHFEVTKETKLLTLQWKILHCIYPTNIFLQKIGIKNSVLCENCGVRDTLEHFFVECLTSKQVWMEVDKTIEVLIGRLPKLCTKEILLGVPFGTNFSKKDTRIVNHVCLIGKMVISKFKYGKYYNIRYLLETELRHRGVIQQI